MNNVTINLPKTKPPHIHQYQQHILDIYATKTSGTLVVGFIRLYMTNAESEAFKQKLITRRQNEKMVIDAQWVTSHMAYEGGNPIQTGEGTLAFEMFHRTRPVGTT